MVGNRSNRTHDSTCFVPGMCEVGSRSHFVLAIGTGEGSAGVRKRRFVPNHTADKSKLGQEAPLSPFGSWGLHTSTLSLEGSFSPVLSSETASWKHSACAWVCTGVHGPHCHHWSGGTIGHLKGS